MSTPMAYMPSMEATQPLNSHKEVDDVEINKETLKEKLKAIQTENKTLAEQSNDLSRQQAAVIEQLRANCGKLQLLEELLKDPEAHENADDKN